MRGGATDQNMVWFIFSVSGAFLTWASLCIFIIICLDWLDDIRLDVYCEQLARPANPADAEAHFAHRRGLGVGR